ncbi:MAG: lysophospholipid acyltransferase family protein [Phycisphaerales bacterium]|jgi:1-acyl-sn-glycerol-3-phosphate acyltransferase|nr:lysophospholipid acyltransferase family protein [Phycisphaerales bacterium]
MIGILRGLMMTFYRYRSHGKRNVPRTGSIIFVANHQSNFDPSIVGVLVADRPFKGIARDTLFKSKLLSAFMRCFGVISIKRGESDIVAIRLAIKELAAGRCIMMFPEGTRTTDGTIGKFQRGFWLLMKKSKATVLPVGFEGAFDAYPIGQKPKLRGYIEVAAGEPIKANELLEMGEEDGTRYVRSKIEELRLQCNELISGRSK